MARIALIGNGMHGHLAPLARLARVLADQGHQLLVWAPSALHHEFAGVEVVEVVDHEPVRLSSPSLSRFAVELAEATPVAVEELVEAMHERGVDLVVHDTHAPWARVAADFLGLPRIVSAPMFPEGTYAGHPELPSEGPFAPTPAQIARVAEIDRAIRRRWGVPLGRVSRTLWSDGPAAINFTTAEITGVPERFPAWTYAGPLLDTGPPPETDAGRPLVYVSFGTVVLTRANGLRVVVDALADEAVDVLVSTGGTAVTRDSLGPLPSNATVRSFVDARKVLARASVFVSHAGTSSVHEALLAGVPMVCQPQGADQFLWSERVQSLGAGRWVAPDKRAVRDAVRELLRDRRTRQRAKELGDGLRGYNGPRRVAELVASRLDAEV